MVEVVLVVFIRQVEVVLLVDPAVVVLVLMLVEVMDGWIDVAALVLLRKKATGDYHDEMIADLFEEWIYYLIYRVTRNG